MADISLVEDDPVDGSDEGVFEQEDCVLNDPQQVLREIHMSFDSTEDGLRKRQQLPQQARLQLELNDFSDLVPPALKEFFDNCTDCTYDELLRVIKKVAETSSRRQHHLVTAPQFLTDIPAFAAVAARYIGHVPELDHFLGMHLLPIIFEFLQVRDGAAIKMAQNSLFALLENNLITPKQIVDEVCPMMLKLTDYKDCSSCNTDYIMLMSQLVVHLGREITESIFLERFLELCTSKEFCVRMLSVGHIGNFCAVVGKEAYDNVLFSSYLTLCTDKCWGVRKSCADVVMYVSCACSPAKRHHLLAPAFAKLLQDSSRWVRISAFRTLGPFISTFADPAVTTMAYNNLGELVALNKDGIELRLSQTLPFLKFTGICCFAEDDDVEFAFDDISLTSRMRRMNLLAEADDIVSLSDLFESVGDDDVEKQKCDMEVADERHSEIETKNESLEEYNSYKYWYVSPEMPLDPSIVDSKASAPKAIFTIPKPQIDGFLRSTFGTSKLTKPETDVIRTSNMDLELGTFKQLDIRELQPQLLPVPKLLIDHFVSMANSSVAEETDNDVAFQCAYSLPAVALTLGSKNWHLLQDTVEMLAANMQYKVRRTVACSLYELATILGSDIASSDLTPMFEGFIKDLDEVRIGVLKHLAGFLRILNPTERNMSLPLLEGFLQTDNKANWRFRYKLAKQLLLIVPLFKPGDLIKHVSFLAQELLCDKVAAVREVALLLVTELIQYVSSDQTRTSHLLVKLAEKFAHSIQWKLRQLFALLCAKLLMSRALPPEQFASEVMPHLLDLSWDPVPNVRLVVARTIAQHMITNEYFANANNQHYDNLQSVLRMLQSDKDYDVRQSAIYEKEINVE